MKLQQPQILVVDDTLANRVALRRLLVKVDADLVEASSGNEALAACLDHEFALILLDVNMPGMDGFEVASLLAEEAQTRETPIVFVTAAHADDLNRLKGYTSGAVDYITKPINDAILLSKVRVFLELYRGRQQLKAALEELFERNRQLEEEIVKRKRMEADVLHLATHDPLTGLANRLLFLNRLDHALQRGRRRGKPFALAYIDIDGFKPINDTYGHKLGDELLKAIAGRLQGRVRQEDTVARLGGDEFALIMEEAGQTPQQGLRLCEQLCSELARPYALDHEGCAVRVELGASVGLALYPLHAQEADGLILAADRAMYGAKRNGKNRCVLAEAGR